LSLRISNQVIDKVFAESKIKEAGFVMLEPHCHPYYELFYVEYGLCTFFIDNTMYELKAGDFILIPPQVFHYTRYWEKSKRLNLFFRRNDISETVFETLKLSEEFFNRLQLFRTPDAYKKIVTDHILKMVKEDNVGDKNTNAYMWALLQEFLILVSRNCEKIDDLPAEIHTTDKPIVDAAKFIADNFNKQITTFDVAKSAGYSTNYLSKKFRQATGTGVHEYLMFIRLQKATQMLTSTNYSIAKIAKECGFLSANYFKDAFKKKYGITPREFRK